MLDKSRRNELLYERRLIRKRKKYIFETGVSVLGISMKSISEFVWSHGVLRQRKLTFHKVIVPLVYKVYAEKFMSEIEFGLLCVGNS